MIEPNYEYITTQEGVSKVCKYLRSKKYVSVDTETTGLDPMIDKVHCVQVGDQYKQFILDYVRT